MNYKKLILSFIAGSVVMSILDALYYQVIMKDFIYEQYANLIRTDPIWVWDLLGYYVGILLMAYIYPHWIQRGKPAIEGLKFGLFIGVIMHLPVYFVLYSHYTLPFAGTMVTVIFQVVEKTVGGIVIGLVYGTGVKTKSD